MMKYRIGIQKFEFERLVALKGLEIHEISGKISSFVCTT